MISINIERKLLLSRILTRSGDQAWDFVVPFALLHVFPGKLQIAAFYYFVIKTGTFLLTTSAGKWIDLNSRGVVVKAGVWAQFFAVLAGIFIFWFLDNRVHAGEVNSSYSVIFLFGFLCLAGTIASIGSVVTDIAVGNDLAPALVPAKRLTWFNAWLKRIDLATEVGAPILAGILYVQESSILHLLGLILIAGWNLVSFVPEYLLLHDIVKHPSLAKKQIRVSRTWKELLQVDVKKSITNPVFPLMFSYALLWLSVLSPHGVLLTAYLKDQFQLLESEIGFFRGAGAVFGLLSTLSFPFLVKKLGLISSAKAHLSFQAIILVVGISAFTFQTPLAIYIFLACVLLSRIGLYGFSNGEFELRQRLIPEASRGELNSLSYLMTTLATLFLFATGSLLPESKDFQYLVYGSLVAVLIANVIFYKWTARQVDRDVNGQL